MKIAIRRERIEKKLDKLTKELIALREECQHPNVEVKHRANVGNYDPSADSYWTEHKCPDCGKFWTIEIE